MCSRDPGRPSDAPDTTEREDERPRKEASDVPKDDDHLTDIPDGCGCAEVWKHLSDRRE